MRQIAFRERAFPAGNIIGVNGYRVNQARLQQRLHAGGYRLERTPHFLIGTREEYPTLLVHRFSPAEIDADLGQLFLTELGTLLGDPERFGHVFAAIVGSLTPHDPQAAWHLFATNTLNRYEQLLTAAQSPSITDNSPVAIFATLYRRVGELVVGESLLDAGCSFGFLPLVAARQLPSLTRILGIDIHTEPFAVTRKLARERHLTRIELAQADLLNENFPQTGFFDTVTALHVLEHFHEDHMYRVLSNLLTVTKRRLIIAVPYEAGQPEATYGHEQLFWPAKLEALGSWCAEQVGGSFVYEECAGGLLFFDRKP